MCLVGQSAGQRIEEISVTGGVSRSRLACEILASVLKNWNINLFNTSQCGAGAAAITLAQLEQHERERAFVDTPFDVTQAVERMVKSETIVRPRVEWVSEYDRLFGLFRGAVDSRSNRGRQ